MGLKEAIHGGAGAKLCGTVTFKEALAHHPFSNHLILF